MSHFYWPEQTGSSQVIAEFAEYLAKDGFSVTVATAMPYYPEWRIHAAYRGKTWTTEDHQGVRILRAWHWVRPNPSTVGRLLHEITLSLFGIPNMVRAVLQADACVVLIPSLSYALTAAVIARVFRRRLVVTVHDIMPDTAIELGMLRNRAIIAVSRWMARSIYRMAAEIQTLGTGMQARIRRNLPADRPVTIVPITVDTRELRPVDRASNEYIRQFGNGQFTVVHTGNMGQKQDFDIILRAAAALKGDPQIHFHIFGEGAAKARVLARLQELGLTNVSHHPLQARPMLPHMLSGADVVLVTQRPEVVDIVVPSKMLTAMAAGAMIIASCAQDSETETLLHSTGSGLVIPAGDDARLVELIRALRTGAISSQRYRTCARETAARYFDRDFVYGKASAGLLAHASRFGMRR